MRVDNSDNLATITSVGLLAYASADITHHVFGHAAACLLITGQVSLVTSQVVRCTVTGSAVDLAGPLASLIFGISALFAARLLRHPYSGVHLFLLLVAAFNLFWFNLQLLYSVANWTDDWAWALQEFRVPSAGRYLLIGVATLGYLFTLRIIARCLKGYAIPRARIEKICFVSWASAGMLACATALFDHDPGQALRRAVPQAMILSIGLLFIPSRASRLSQTGLSAQPPYLGSH